MKQLLVPLLFWALLFSAMAVTPSYGGPSASGIARDTTENDTPDFSLLVGADMTAAVPLAFGGRILAVVPCTCSAGLALKVGPPRPAYVLYQPGVSILFSFYNLLPPDYALGTYKPGGVCLTGTPPVCLTVPTLGTVTLVGTSLTPLSPSI